MSAATMPRPAARLGFHEQELAAIDDVCRLAELWESALRASFQLGYGSGYDRGVVEGRREEGAAWTSIVTGYAAVIDKPAFDELTRRRKPSNDPCRTSCGRCSQCVRAAAVLSNQARYGTPDFPGFGPNGALS
jgi:hypothetical protein